MFCPNCGNPCEESHHFCYLCGTELPKLNIENTKPATDSESLIPEETQSPESTVPAEQEAAMETPVPAPAEECPDIHPAEPTEPAPEPKPRKGRIWPPILAMAVMICVGLAVFFMGSSEEPPVSAPSWFEIENGVLSFHPEYYTGSRELTIPETVDGQTVTAIADNAFSGCDGISTVILPETVTAIGDYAFSSCHDLRGIYIPGSVQAIGVYAFADCDSLEAIYLPGTLEELGHGALDSCDGLNFILFNGTYARWNELYDGLFSSSVELHTTDGTYYARP